MSNLDNLINDLVIANRILANEDVVDAYGHVSVRHPDRPDPAAWGLAAHDASRAARPGRPCPMTRRSER